MLWRGLKRFMQEKDFYIENFLLFIMQYFAYVIGIIGHYFFPNKEA